MTRALRHTPPTPNARLLAVAHKVWNSGVDANRPALRRAIEEASNPHVYLTAEELVLLGAARAMERVGEAHPQRAAIRKAFGEAVMLVARQEVPKPAPKYTGGALRDERGAI
ncbi:MAG: hypothetical protein P1U84_12025 [Parvibaculaceae bacterium]|nr:hypothetical protein [Parvibaculaceae bacterium]